MKDSKRLFFDNKKIEMVQDITRVFHCPQRLTQEPLIKKDRPWEHVTYFQCTNWNVLYNKKEKIFKCWYEDWAINTEGLAKTNVDITDPSVSGSYICYAISHDGIHWEKPEVGIKLGDLKTNIVFGDAKYGPGNSGSVHAATILDDPTEKNPEKRYKMIFQHITLNSGSVYVDSNGHGGPQVLHSPIKLATSADGISWKIDPRILSFGNLGPKLGDVILLSYDKKLGKYILNTRHPDAWKIPLNPNKNPRTKAWSLPYYPGDSKRMNKRRIFQCESTDLIHWNEPYLVLQPDDEEDILDESFYGLNRIPLGDGYIGLLSVFHSVDNTEDVQLVYSRDGKKWQRMNKRQPVFIGGPAGSWDQYMVFMTNPLLEVNDELWIYYSGAQCHHDWWVTGRREGLDTTEAYDFSKINYGLGLAKLRLDGFVSLQAGAVREGLVITHPLPYTGQNLQINGSCGAKGYIDIEVVRYDDTVLPGFSREDFDSYRGDNTRHICTWRGKRKLDIRDNVKLRIYMRDTDLYSIQFVDNC